MTDREMLELAAKAYGFGDPEGNFIWTESEYPRGSKTNGALWNYMGWCDTAQLWNPLTDDGDALRLAVKLGASDGSPLRICIEYQHDGEQDFTCVEHFGENTVYHAVDPAEATRRAIVMAAAQAGKEMK